MLQGPERAQRCLPDVSTLLPARGWVPLSPVGPVAAGQPERDPGGHGHCLLTPPPVPCLLPPLAAPSRHHGDKGRVPALETRSHKEATARRPWDRASGAPSFTHNSEVPAPWQPVGRRTPRVPCTQHKQAHPLCVPGHRAPTVSPSSNRALPGMFVDWLNEHSGQGKAGSPLAFGWRPASLDPA